MVFCFIKFSFIFQKYFLNLTHSLQELYNLPNETKIKLPSADGYRRDKLVIINND
jgi:hypothetical protein